MLAQVSLVLIFCLNIVRARQSLEGGIEAVHRARDLPSVLMVTNNVVRQRHSIFAKMLDNSDNRQNRKVDLSSALQIVRLTRTRWLLNSLVILTIPMGCGYRLIPA